MSPLRKPISAGFPAVFPSVRPRALAIVLLAGLAAPRPGLRSQDGAADEIRPYDQVSWENASNILVQVSGKILSEAPDKIEIQQINPDGTSSGIITIDVPRVKKVIPRRTAQQVYETRAKRVARSDAGESEKAPEQLRLGLWCLSPNPQIRGEAPMPEKAFGHLLKAIQMDPRQHAAYPPLIDFLAARRAGKKTGEDSTEQELEVYQLAEAGGYRHPDIDIRLGEIYLETGLSEEAEKKFGGILETEDKANASLRQRSRQYLAKIYLARGDAEKAMKLYWPDPKADAGNPEAFEKFYRSAWFLLSRGKPADRVQARAFLEEARKLQSDYPGVPLQLAAIDLLEGKLQSAENRLRTYLPQIQDSPDDAAGYLCGLGFVQLERGKFQKAEDQFKKALAQAGGRKEGATLGILGEEESTARCQAHLGLGLLREYRGDLPGAIAEYQLAQETAGQSWPLGAPGPAILLARAHLAAGELDKARKILEQLIKSQPDDSSAFAAYSRSLADVEIASGSENQAHRVLENCIQIESGDAFLQRKLGVALLRKGQLDLAFPYLSSARDAAAARQEGEQPESHAALGYYHYRKNDLDEAEKAFRKVLSLVPRPVKASKDAPPPVVPPLRLYAEKGLALVIDARTLEVWEDNFERDTGEEIHRGWMKFENFGIRPAIKEGHILFQGQQENAADGVTKLYRELDARDVSRVSARFRFEKGSAAASGTRSRAGVRIETTEKDVGAGLVFFRDLDGTLKASIKTTRSNWEDIPVSPEKDPTVGKLVYSGEVKWPDDGAYHTLMIREADPASKGKGYDLLLDGTPAAMNVQVGGLGRTAKVLQVGISGQAEALGGSYRFEVDDFRIFREKVKEETRGRR